MTVMCLNVIYSNGTIYCSKVYLKVISTDQGHLDLQTLSFLDSDCLKCFKK